MINMVMILMMNIMMVLMNMMTIMMMILTWQSQPGRRLMAAGFCSLAPQKASQVNHHDDDRIFIKIICRDFHL